MDLRAGNRLPLFIHLGNSHAAETFTAFNVDDRVAQVQGNIKVIQTLNNITVQAGRIGHQFNASKHLGTLQGHAASHDQANVAAAQNHHPLAGHVAFQIDEFLCSAGTVNACAAGARRTQSAPGTFPAAHGQHDGLGMNQLHTMLCADAGHHMIRLHGQHRGITLNVNVQLTSPIHIPLGVFRAGQFFLKAVETKTVVNALAQNTAGGMFTFQYKQAFNAVLPGSNGRRQSGRAAADNQHIHLQHAVFSRCHVSRPP